MAKPTLVQDKSYSELGGTAALIQATAARHLDPPPLLPCDGVRPPVNVVNEPDAHLGSITRLKEGTAYATGCQPVQSTSGADAFTVMKLMGHSTVSVSQRYVRPSPEAVELVYERFTALNLKRVESPQIPPQWSGAVLRPFSKAFVFIMPGWRNR